MRPGPLKEGALIVVSAKTMANVAKAVFVWAVRLFSV